jgi:hypothetical protein
MCTTTKNDTGIKVTMTKILDVQQNSIYELTLEREKKVQIDMQFNNTHLIPCLKTNNPGESKVKEIYRFAVGELSQVELFMDLKTLDKNLAGGITGPTLSLKRIEGITL